MKKIMLMVLLAAAGCSKKGPDCSAAVDKGIDGYIAAMKQIAARSSGFDISKTAGPLKAALTQRCTEDKWQPEVVTCIGSATGPDSMKACEEKMTPDQKTKLDLQVRSVMRDATGASGSHMPPGVDGHPATLGGAANGSAAPSGDPSGSSAPGGAEAAPASPPDPPAAPRSGGW
jgi:hypothetical protein